MGRAHGFATSAERRSVKSALNVSARMLTTQISAHSAVRRSTLPRNTAPNLKRGTAAARENGAI
jgi:hypothetical protein